MLFFSIQFEIIVLIIWIYGLGKKLNDIDKK